ncbi:hypothetical protein ATO6_07450 [Oceanicola sp. 22II-s10i]|nr:hypothetical protein ATO6_07450 [Oceanicola sp. 22II-s10i]
MLAACDETASPRVTPQARPAALVPPAKPAEPSAASKELSTYYARVQADLLVQGLLRQDGGGVDTPYTAAMLARNFERIALYDEYARGAGLRVAKDSPSHLRRWSVPVRMAVEFGPSVPQDVRDEDRRTVAGYAARLARLTGHSILVTPVASTANFNILVMNEDERPQAVARIRQLVPNISENALDIFRTLPRSIHCLVVAFSGSGTDYEYRRAIALVRAEHPDLMRKSCYHEELAQGLGLANDSPEARPSIFNDDDEFALLTTHDEMLLRILYDPRLRPGMSPDQARPIVSQIVAGLSGGPS